MPSSGNGTDPLAHIRPGDEADDMLCKDQHGPWMCTRDLQHPGQHIASVGYGQRVGAVWPAVPAETLRDAVGRYVDYGPPGPWKIRLNEALIRDQRADVSARPAAGQPPAQKLCFAPLPEQPSDLGNLVARCGQPYGHDGRHVPLAAPADEPCVCTTDFTCMATEHTSPAADLAAPSPRRGGPVEAWVKRWRDAQTPHEARWHALDELLDDLRDRADIGASWSDQIDDTAGYPQVIPADEKLTS